MKQRIFLLTLFLISRLLYAGNPERQGQAGATQLLINPYARSSGMNGINISNSYGIESIINNPAGLAHTKRTEIVFSHTRWLVGSDININTFGLSQGFKKGGVLGLAVMAMDLGEFERTTVDQPDGTLGTFKPTFMNIGLSYARTFVEDRIYVGVTAKLIHESIPDVAANGMAFDAGVQYKDKQGKFKMGVCLRNIGPEMRYSGDGLSARANLGGNNSAFTSNVSSKAASFELPSVLMIGASYDFAFGGDSAAAAHYITPIAAFVANSFANDQYGIGIEYRFKRYFMARYSFLYENGILSEDNRKTAFTGHAVGATVEIPFKSGQDKISTFGFDYSFRTTWLFSGTHSLGIRINL